MFHQASDDEAAVTVSTIMVVASAPPDQVVVACVDGTEDKSIFAAIAVDQ